MSSSLTFKMNRYQQLWLTVIIGSLYRHHLASQESAPIQLHYTLMETKGIRGLKDHRTAPHLGILSLTVTRISKLQPLNKCINSQLPTRAEGSLPLLCPRVSREKKSSRIHPLLTTTRASLKRHNSEAYHNTRRASPKEFLVQLKAKENLFRKDRQRRVPRTISTLICKRVRGQAQMQSNIQRKLRKTKAGKSQRVSWTTELSIKDQRNQKYQLHEIWSIKIRLATLSTIETLYTAKPPGLTSLSATKSKKTCYSTWQKPCNVKNPSSLSANGVMNFCFRRSK